MPRFDAIAGYHLNPVSCGVARFNAQLAARLGVPVLPLAALPHCRYRHVLVSLKWDELSEAARATLDPGTWPDHTLLWHGTAPSADACPDRAVAVLHAEDVGAPALVTSAPLPMSGVWFSLGMAHKPALLLDYAHAVRLAVAAGESPHLLLSTGIHEGSSWDDVDAKLTALRRIVPTTCLGAMSDEGLRYIWPHVSVFVAFFTGGLRANHTSVHAALDAGIPVLTNWGGSTPADLRACTVNLDSLITWPAVWTRPTGSPYTWARVMEALCDKH